MFVSSLVIDVLLAFLSDGRVARVAELVVHISMSSPYSLPGETRNDVTTDCANPQQRIA